MKTNGYLLYLLIVLCFWSCSNINDDFNSLEDCPVPAIELPQILIELVDENGTNLIANGTFLAEDIRLEYPGYAITDFLVGEEGGEIEYLIRVFVNDLGPETVNIVLSDSISDTFAFTVIDLASDDPPRRNQLGCPIHQMDVVIEDATYNDIPQNIRDFNNDFGDVIVTIVR